MRLPLQRELSSAAGHFVSPKRLALCSDGRIFACRVTFRHEDDAWRFPDGNIACAQSRNRRMSDPESVYEEWFVPAVFAPLARQVLAMTDIRPGARVLDVACGS